jgi:ribonuclease G
MKSIYINCEDFDTNVAIAEEGRLVNYFSEKNIYAKNGNIYKGRITKIVSNMNFVFVDIGDEKPAFLSEKEYFDMSGGEFKESFGAFEDTATEADIPAIQENIAGIFEKGQELMVQVVKEPYSTKGARLTTNITLPGQHIVFAPYIKHTGVSKRITDDAERDRLRSIIHKARRTYEGEFGIIVRTNAAGVDGGELEKEIEHFYRQWEAIRSEYKKYKAPRVIYTEQDLAIKVLREYVDATTAEIITDDEKTHDSVKWYMEETSKKNAKVMYYGGVDHIFEYYKLASQVDGIFNNIVSFKKGGYIKIDVTEALTVIDINSGKFKGVEDVENSLLNINMNAAKEVARQLILRNIGGLIVVDFIDMQEEANRKKVKAVMDEELAKSKMYFKTLEISEYGLMEITRKRDSKRVDDVNFAECQCCQGRGRVLNEESVCINYLKKIKYACKKAASRGVLVMMPEKVKKSIESLYKDRIRDYERRYGKKLTIKIGTEKEAGA